jgi:AcrR family transcriptional regulator
MASAVVAPRLYRGMSASERRAERRKRLLAAGLELFGTEGYANTSIRAVSATAGLNSRYFYESFNDREDLLYHVYKRIAREILRAAVAAAADAETMQEKAHAGLRAGWVILTEDPRKARIVALEVVGVSERLERLRRRTRHRYADLLFVELLPGEARKSAPGDAPFDPRLTGRALMGGVVELLGDWVYGDVDASVPEIVDLFTRMFAAAAARAAERVATSAEGPR